MRDKTAIIQEMLLWNSAYEYAYLMLNKKATKDNFSDLVAAIDTKVAQVVEESIRQAVDDWAISNPDIIDNKREVV